MAPNKRNNITEMKDEEKFRVFFELIQERQRLEEKYYATGDQLMLPEIEKARERIRDVMMEMGITLPFQEK